MIRTLRGRIGLAIAASGLAILVAMGGALFVVLRDLYRTATVATVAGIAVPTVAQARMRFGPGERREPGDVLGELREQIADGELLVGLVRADGSGLELTGGTSGLTGLALRLPDERGGLTTGSGAVEGVGPVVWAAVPLFGDRSPDGLRWLVVAAPDRSTPRALEALLGALLVAGVVLVVVGAPLAWVLSRSVARPLGRLAAATGVMARGDLPVVLPEEGPAEVAHATAAFNAMAAEVARSRAAQRSLIADLRHDLRTPVTVIAGFAEAIADGTLSGPGVGRAATSIAEEAGRIERMVGDLTLLTDPDGGDRALAIEPLDAGALVRETAARFAAAAEARDRRISVDAPAGPIGLSGDRTACERILANLAANALAHARAAIVLEAGPEDGGIVLAIRDDGPGIPAEILPRVFDRFFRGDPARSGPGSGLGLAIVAELAAAMGGRAFAESPPSGGARVGVRLPAAPAETGILRA